MTLHLVKLCVGCDTVEELATWQRQRIETLLKSDPKAELMHVTRQTPRRVGFAPGSSIYWVFNGFIRARQTILGLRDVVGADGISRCGLALGLTLIATEPQPRRPFQGWRYLRAEEAPKDLTRTASEDDDALPPGMRADLTELRLLS